LQWCLTAAKDSSDLLQFPHIGTDYTLDVRAVMHSLHLNQHGRICLRVDNSNVDALFVSVIFSINSLGPPDFAHRKFDKHTSSAICRTESLCHNGTEKSF